MLGVVNEFAAAGKAAMLGGFSRYQPCACVTVTSTVMPRKSEIAPV